MKPRLTVAISVLLCSFSSYLFAYEIGQKAIEEDEVAGSSFEADSLLGLTWERNHERLTAMALQCLGDANKGGVALSVKPVACANPDTWDSIDYTFLTDPSSYPAGLEPYWRLLRTVRWSDDPTRQVDRKGESAAKFGATMKLVCSERLEDDKFGAINVADDGLLCASHFGSMQFLHAMASGDGIERDATALEIEQWASFAFAYSLEDSIWTTSYCDHWSSNSYAAIQPAFDASSVRDRGWCEERKKPFFKRIFSSQKTYPGWTVATTFSFSCDGIVSSGTCDVLFDSDEIRMAALGSILHSIQDSFSKSHAVRGGNERNPEVVCRPVKQFLSYSSQDPASHAVSDKFPTLDSSCHDGEAGRTLDPVTASAQVIWLHANAKSGGGNVVDVVTATLGTPSQSLESSAGEAYSIGVR